MDRRDFLASAAVGTLSALPAAAQGAGALEYYELRQYHLHQGTQPKLAEDFWRDAGVPALKRLGIGPVGVFNVVYGPNSPTLYVLIPHKTAESIVTLPTRLAADAEYQKAGEAFLGRTLAEPAYARFESTLLAALTGFPKIQPPPAAAEKKPRMFELRIYECHSERSCAAKAHMFNNGEIALFDQHGFHSVFFSQSLIGTGTPNITYMLSFDDMAARDKNFGAFATSAEFRKLAGMAPYKDLLTNITNIILRPTAFSEI